MWGLPSPSKAPWEAAATGPRGIQTFPDSFLLPGDPGTVTAFPCAIGREGRSSLRTWILHGNVPALPGSAQTGPDHVSVVANVSPAQPGAAVAEAGGSPGLQEKEEVAARTSHCHQHLPGVGMFTSPGALPPSPCAMSAGTEAGREIGQEAAPRAVVGSPRWKPHLQPSPGPANAPSPPPPPQFVC